jgi:hypothetical protein
MTIMFHSITDDPVATAAYQITAGDQRRLMNDLHDLGYQAINTQQMIDFMYSNAKIPSRSVLLIVDDRHDADYFNKHFRPFREKWNWPVVNAWISAFGGSDPVLQGNVALSNEGWVDYQAHGVVHNIPMTNSSQDDFLVGELEGSITNMETYFSKIPLAIIWPGGGFGARPVQFARQFGYRLGFTINARGPVMYNWVPQADQLDPARPIAIAEGPVNDPLMTLPRYTDLDARRHLDTVAQIGEQAAAYAEQNKAVELEYYDIVCAPSLGPLP